MAKKAKPKGLSWDDLVDYAASMMGGTAAPTKDVTSAMGQAVNRATVKYLDPRDFGQPNRLATDVWDYANPLPMITAEETKRLVEKGPDRGHLASAALLAAFMKAPDAIKGIRGLLRSASSVSKDKGVQPAKPMRKQAASLGGTANDPMAQYAALLALTNRR